MKKFTLFSFLFIFTFLFGAVKAQKTVNVPGTYSTITQALAAEFLLLENGDSLIIRLGEGTLYAQNAVNTNITWPAKKLGIAIVGAGPDKTIQKAVEGRDARIAEDVDGTRLMQIDETAGMDGSTLTFKDMAFQYLGSYRKNQAVGCVANILINKPFTVNFENVVFDNCIGAAVVSNPRNIPSLTITNCLFKECVASNRRDNTNLMRGIVAKDGGNLTIRNTVFISNENADLLNGTNSFVVNPQVYGTYFPMNVILEDNAFINNKNVTPASTSISAVVGLKVDAAISSDQYTASLKNNIMIGNKSSNGAVDADIFVLDPAKVVINTASGNILNKSLKPGVEVGTYENFIFNGSKVDASYTYTDSRINFTMAGELPALVNDAKGIGKVSYSGDGGSPNSVSQLSKTNVYAYPNPSTGKFAINLPVAAENVRYKVYNSLGGLVKEGLLTTQRTEINLSGNLKGLYILNVSNNSFNHFERLVIK